MGVLGFEADIGEVFEVRAGKRHIACIMLKVDLRDDVGGIREEIKGFAKFSGRRFRVRLEEIESGEPL